MIVIHSNPHSRKIPLRWLLCLILLSQYQTLVQSVNVSPLTTVKWTTLTSPTLLKKKGVSSDCIKIFLQLQEVLLKEKKTLQEERRLKQLLSQQILQQKQINPLETVRSIIRYLHENETIEIVDEAVDWLLYLPAGPNSRAEIEEENRLDVLYPDEESRYVGTSYKRIRAFARKLHLTKDDIFYDLGSGLGRVPIYLGLATGVGQVCGVELVLHRVRASRRSAKKLGLNHVTFLHANAGTSTTDFSNGTVFYLFNPFSDKTLSQVIASLQKIARHHPIRLVSRSIFESSELKAEHWLRKTHEIRLPNDPGYRMPMLIHESIRTNPHQQLEFSL